MCTYKIAKKLKMTGGRVRYALKKLKEAGLVKFEYEHASRTKKLCYPVDAWELIPKEWKPKLRKMMKNLKRSK
jgi:predicted transcriptional regulator